MRPNLFFTSLLATGLFVIGSAATAQPTYQFAAPANFKAPKANLEKWAARFRQLCPKRDWTVSIDGNDILIQRDKPVLFRVSRDGPQSSKLERIEKPYRLRLQFGPILTLDKYEELVAQNSATSIQRSKLLEKHRVSLLRGFTGLLELFADTPQQKEDYLAEAKKLVFYRLPDFYTPDYSITVLQSWDNNTERVYTNDMNVDDECNVVKNSLPRSFGVYNSEVANGFRNFGLEEHFNQSAWQ